jgi:hypothetical protein
LSTLSVLASMVTASVKGLLLRERL